MRSRKGASTSLAAGARSGSSTGSATTRRTRAERQAANRAASAEAASMRPSQPASQPDHPAVSGTSRAQGVEHHVGVPGRHVGHREALTALDQRPQAVPAVGRREQGAHVGALRSAPLVRRDDRPAGADVLGGRHLQPAAPVRVGVRGIGEPASVGVRPQRDASGQPVAHGAGAVGHDQVVDRLDPALPGGHDVVGAARAQQGQQRSEAAVALLRDGGAQRQATPLGQAALDHLAPGRADDLDLDIGPAGHLDLLDVVLAHRARVLRVEDHRVDVLVVGHRVGDRPGGIAGVAEVGGPGTPGKARPMTSNSGQESRTCGRRPASR